MFEFIKNMFKREEPKQIPGVTYTKVSRIPVKKFEPEEFKPRRFNPDGSQRILRVRYLDTNEIVEKPADEAITETMMSGRPVFIEGFVD